MGKKVFVSFDYDNDRHYKYLLEAWSANPNFDFVFEDRTSREIDSYDFSRIKAALTTKISSATYTLVLIGKYANKKHEDSAKIGDINWINWEINKSKEYGNKLVGVKLESNYGAPDAIYGSNASWVTGFSEMGIINALNKR